jgi:tetratricopeptide (TPR) repeat protein
MMVVMKFLLRIGVLALMVLFLTVGLGFGQNTADQIWTKGVEHAAQGNFNEAKVEFEKALKIDPYYGPAKRALKVVGDAINQKIKSKAAIHLFKGIAYDINSQWDEAIVEYNMAIEINPGYAQSYFTRGGHYVQKGQYDKAISDFNKAIEINPKYATAYSNRGVAYLVGKGQYDKAISDFNKAIEINPRDADAYLNRGVAYLVGKGQYDKAISDFNKAIDINPRDADAYYNRGKAYLVGKGEFDRAISDYNKAIEINPKYATAYNDRGIAYFSKREYEKTWDDVHKAESLGYKVHPEFLKALREASGRQE